MRKRAVLLLCGLILIFCGCRRSRYRGVEFESYIPPTLVATVANTPTVNPITPMPTSAMNYNCNSYLSYLDDVTVPDGTTFVPGDEIVKTWAVMNLGECGWNEKYSLRFLEGNLMGADPRQPLPSLEAGESGEVTVIFTAPEYAGSYYSGWMAYDAKGDAFGDEIFIEIYVDPYYTINESQGDTTNGQGYGYGYGYW